VVLYLRGASTKTTQGLISPLIQSTFNRRQWVSRWPRRSRRSRRSRAHVSEVIAELVAIFGPRHSRAGECLCVCVCVCLSVCLSVSGTVASDATLSSALQTALAEDARAANVLAAMCASAASALRVLVYASAGMAAMAGATDPHRPTPADPHPQADPRRPTGPPATPLSPASLSPAPLSPALHSPAPSCYRHQAVISAIYIVATR